MVLELRTIRLWLVIAAVTSCAWLVLRQSSPRVPWLDVFAPIEAVPGRPFVVHVVPKSVPETPNGSPSLLKADLHAFPSRADAPRIIVAGRAQPIVALNTSIEFELGVPKHSELSHVAIVVYASPSGRWWDRVASARSERIPVSPGASADAPEVALAMNPLQDEATGPRRDRFWVRIAIAIGWILFAWCAAGSRVRSPSGRGALRVLPIAGVAAALWVLSAAEGTLGALARSAAVALNLYEQRFGFQRIATAAVVVVVAAILYRALRASTFKLEVAGLTVYAGVSAASFLSLHGIDWILARSFLSIPVLQWLQLCGMLTALIGALSDKKERERVG